MKKVALGLLMMASCLAAADTVSPWDIDINSVKIREIQEAAVEQPRIANDCSEQKNAPKLVTDGVSWDQIVNIGQKIWEIVNANKPVVNINQPVAYALPRGLHCWSDLDSWKAPETKSYEVSYANGFGSEVVKFRFRLQYTYGGGHKGIGRYLTNVTVMPADLSVSWGYTFNAHVEAAQAVNLGTAKDPMAGLEMNVLWKVDTVLKSSQGSFHFFVQGDGLTKAAN
jgi:hypothetical protein